MATFSFTVKSYWDSQSKDPNLYLWICKKKALIILILKDYDFNDDALVYGASFFARVVEKTLVAE